MFELTPESTLVPIPKPKHSMLPLLVVLFIVSYGVMALLVVEQGRTIDTQRYLIRQLFGDSVELTSMKGKAAIDQNARAQAQAAPGAHAQQPGPLVESKPQEKGKHNVEKRKPAPLKPPKDASDEADERRALIAI